MTRDEVMDLGRKVAAICPAQRFNDQTPDAWLALLSDVDYADAVAALRVLGRTHEYIAPRDIIREVRRLRAERVKGLVVPAPSPEDTDVPERYRARLRASVHQAAAGRPDRPALESGGRAEQFRTFGQRYVDPSHKPAVDSRPAPVREALAAARRACREASPTRAVPDVDGTHQAATERAAVESADPVRGLGSGLREIVRTETGR